MYVRFVVDEIDENSGVERGIFQAMFRLWRAGQLHPCEEAWWEDIRWWFNIKLEEPRRFARARRAGANPCAISWFKASASWHVARAHEMVALLAEHYVPSRMLRTKRPGYVVYEDQFQITAEPFRPEHRRASCRGACAMKLPPVDVLGRRLRKGDWVRLIALPSDLKTCPAPVRRVFRRALGLTFRVEGFGRYGHVELDLTKKVAHLEFIWVEPYLLRRSRTP